MFREGWVTINSVPTHIMTWGGWIEDEISSDSIVIFIPGNPGITDFYFYFLQTLHSIVGIPTWTISHAGNEPSPANLLLPPLDQHPDLYNLQGQVEHKKEFLRKYLPEEKKLFLIGHSLGGKISVELMKDEKFSTRLSQAHLVFPTLQHIAETLNGKIYMKIIQHIIPVFVSLAWVFVHFPLSIQKAILSTFMRFRTDWKNSDKETCIAGIMKLFTPQGAKSSLILAKDEMHKIKALDSEIYEIHYDKIFCYFGQHDNWAPLSQYYHLMETHPKVNGKILDTKFTHSFVLTTPTEMAEELGNSIKAYLKS